MVRGVRGWKVVSESGFRREAPSVDANRKADRTRVGRRRDESWNVEYAAELLVELSLGEQPKFALEVELADS